MAVIKASDLQSTGAAVSTHFNNRRRPDVRIQSRVRYICYQCVTGRTANKPGCERGKPMSTIGFEKRHNEAFELMTNANSSARWLPMFHPHRRKRTVSLLGYALIGEAVRFGSWPCHGAALNAFMAGSWPLVELETPKPGASLGTPASPR
jgi:hypothetical protein